MLHGTAGSASLLSVSKKMNDLRERPMRCSIDLFYNLDETVFFFNIMPWRKHVLLYESKRSVCGAREI